MDPQIALDDACRLSALNLAKLEQTPRWRWLRRQRLERERIALILYRLRTMTYNSKKEVPE